MPELVGSCDRKEARAAAAFQASAALDQAALAHDAQHALAVDRPAELAHDERRDHAIAVGLVGTGDVDDRGLCLVSRRALAARPPVPGLRNAVDRLAADLCDARHRVKRDSASGFR
jgi:hypothetical protein